MAKTKALPARGVVDAAVRAADHLEALGARFALVGGIAVGALRRLRRWRERSA